MDSLRLHHVAVRAADVDTTVTFYRDVLTLPVVRDERPRSVWLELCDGSLIMVEAREDGEPPIAPGSKELMALRVSEERKAAIRELAIARSIFDGETAHTVYLRDPDGRRIGVSTYPLIDG